ncbi:hypothetical protein [Wolbachia pipientis]|uniref:hypothetical protein n=1 Tax=Wolbachia pipientis TaxID=955 RepID=UPI0025A41FFB|nr:hypothetical protein [Wolbachia pipientis]
MYESFLLPNPSLEFPVNDSTLKEYYDRQSNTGEMQLTVSGRGDQTGHSGLLIKDLSGNIVCKVHSNMLVITEKTKLTEYLGELLQKDYEYVTVATSNKTKTMMTLQSTFQIEMEILLLIQTMLMFN